MDSQIAHPHGHKYEQDPHDVGLQSVGEGEEEHHHEKRSVLKKVKAKAKKIKDTITKHGHGHNHDHACDHVPDDHDLDEEDEDEEIVEGPDVHGAPMHGSAAVRSSVPGQVESLVHPGVQFERSTAMHVDPKERTEANTSSTGNYQTKVTDPPKIHVPGQDGNKGQPGVNFGKTTVMGDEPHGPQNTPESFASGIYETKETDTTRTFVHGQEVNPGQPRVNLERPKGLEEDTDAPKDNSDAYTPSNYQAKVNDPTGTGGQEAGITPILHSLDKMNIYDEPETKSKAGPEQSQMFNLSTGSHDQFSPDPMPPKPITTRENPHLDPETFDATKHQDQQSSYSETMSSATSAISDKAISEKNVVSSKLGYGEKDDTTAHESSGGGDNAKSASPVDYGKKIAATVTEKLTPVYEKVAGAGSTVMSKMPGTSTGTGNEQQEGGVKGQDKGVSVKDYFAEKLRPGEEDRALSEVISDALHKRKEELGKVTGSRPMGKVTESEEVKRRLGSEDEDSGERVDSDSSFVNSPGKGVVDKLKGAFGSWFGKGEVPQESFGSSYGNEGFSSSASGEAGQNSGVEGERRLQESGN